MTHRSKRVRALREKVDKSKFYDIEDAMQLLKECAVAKFDESVDIAVNLGVDPRKSDQVVRGSTVGMDELADQIKQGNLDFDVVIAAPDAMRIVGQLGKILGPRGLMPNPKVGTVTPDVATAVKNAKAGQVQFRTDKAGIIHCTIGKCSFEPVALQENMKALLADLNKAKPSASKGIYLQKVTLSSTMGPGIPVDKSTIIA